MWPSFCVWQWNVFLGCQTGKWSNKCKHQACVRVCAARIETKQHIEAKGHCCFASGLTGRKCLFVAVSPFGLLSTCVHGAIIFLKPMKLCVLLVKKGFNVLACFFPGPLLLCCIIASHRQWWYPVHLGLTGHQKDNNFVWGGSRYLRTHTHTHHTNKWLEDAALMKVCFLIHAASFASQASGESWGGLWVKASPR